MDISVGPGAERRTAAWIAERLREAHLRRSDAFLALSGGSTAPPMIAALLDDDVPWEFVTVWQVDERVAPDGDDDRNANHLEVLPCLIRPMPVTDDDLRLAADQYAARLPERFDVVHLGIGDDGHTASWPPGDDGPIRSERGVEVIEEFNGRPRMTLTRRVVDSARSRAVLTVGRDKRDVVRRWLDGDSSLPISQVTTDETYVFLDDAAAPDGIGTGG